MWQRQDDALPVRLYRRALVILPREFRRRYAAGTASMFADEWRERRGLARGALLSRALFDLLRTAATERISGSGRRHEQEAGMRRVNLLEDAWKDLRHGARGLRRSPGFTAVTVLILALGIGAATAIFSVAYGVLFRSLPYEDPAQLVRLYWTDPTYEFRATISPPMFMSLRERTRTFADIAAYASDSQTLTGRGEAMWVDGAWVSAGFFEVMGAKPILGRTFVEGENRPGSNDIVVISHALWQELGGESADISARH